MLEKKPVGDAVFRHQVSHGDVFELFSRTEANRESL
ncbi:hypothetical protein X975_22482, partial [Stegodyphus mimosarum]